MDTKGCIKIATTAAASQYVVIAANTNAQPDQLASYAIKSDEGETVPSGSLLVSPYRVSSQLSIATADQPGALQASFEASLRRMERRELNFAAGKQAYKSRVANAGVKMSVSAAAIEGIRQRVRYLCSQVIGVGPYALRHRAAAEQERERERERPCRAQASIRARSQGANRGQRNQGDTIGASPVGQPNA